MQQALSTSNFKRAIAIVLSIVLISGSIYYLSLLMNDKAALGGKHHFYTSGEKYEVLMFGTSHILDTIYPMELYRDYGIMSYNLGEPAERMAMTYYSLQSAVKRNKPKLIVLDTYGLLSKDTKHDPKSSVRSHYTFDAMPLDMIKIKGVLDCMDEEHRQQMLFPLDSYHGRWAGLTKEDFTIQNYRECAHGAEIIATVTQTEGPELIGQDNYKWVEDNSTIYTEKIIDFCREQGIDILLINIPSTISKEHQMRTNLAYEISKRKNVPYLDMMYISEEIGIDYSTDDADGVSHLNPIGARKVTKYFGRYLKDKYDLTDYRDSNLLDDEYTTYCIHSKDEKIKSITEPASYMTMIADEDYSAHITVYDKAVYDNPVLSALLSLKGYDWEIKDAFDESEDCAMKIIVTDNVTGGEIDEKAFDLEVKNIENIDNIE